MDNVPMAMALEAVRFSDAISAKNLMVCDMAIPPCFLRMVLYSIYVNFIRRSVVYECLDAMDASNAENLTAETLNGLGFIKEMQAKKTRNFLENAYWFGMCSVYEPNHVAAR
nr:ABC transporter F family member 1 [Tanacetum cinerariifolium]